MSSLWQELSSCARFVTLSAILMELCPFEILSFWQKCRLGAFVFHKHISLVWFFLLFFCISLSVVLAMPYCFTLYSHSPPLTSHCISLLSLTLVRVQWTTQPSPSTQLCSPNLCRLEAPQPRLLYGFLNSDTTPYYSLLIVRLIQAHCDQSCHKSMRYFGYFQAF